MNMQKNHYRGFRVALGFWLVNSLGLTSVARAASEWICTKRSRQVYHAFYRAEIRESPSGSWRFDYGIGDRNQIFELYFSSAISPSGSRPGEVANYESPPGVEPRLRIKIKPVRKKTKLEFTIVTVEGQQSSRDGLLCDGLIENDSASTIRSF